MNNLNAVLKNLRTELIRAQEKFLTLFPTPLPLAQSYLLKLSKSRGKRIRPALLLLSVKLFAPEKLMRDETLELACIVESVHLASLLHDDVIDNALKRRGKTNLNNNKLSVILADYLISQALNFLSIKALPQYVKVLTRTFACMALGQMEEMQHQGDFKIQEPAYLRIISYKTGSLFSAACELGAMIAGAKAAERRAIAQYGLNLGIAFQIIDDALDFWGKEEELGKPVGGDYREGKFTLPMIIALSKGTQAEGEILKEAQGQGSFSQVLKILKKCNCKKLVYDEAQIYITKAIKSLTRIKGDKAALESLAGSLLKRER